MTASRPDPVSAGSPRRPIRILIGCGLVGGGVRTQLRNLFRVLPAAGAEVTVASGLNEWTAREMRQARECGVRLLAPGPIASRIKPLAKFQALLTWPWRLERDFDTLLFIGNSRLQLRMLRYKKPSGFAIYNEPSIAPPPGSPAFQTMQRVDGIITMSEIIAARVRTMLPDRPVLGLPHLIHSEPMPPPAAKPARGANEIRFVYLGRVYPEKGIEKLVTRWPAITAQAGVAPARLDIHGPDMGDGSLDRIRRFVADQSWRESIGVHGPYAPADLDAILAHADAVVLPSEYEGLPIVLLEAMLRGIPVVATRVGGVGELANPDVEIVDLDDGPIAAGMARIARKLRSGQIDAQRLGRWTEAHYGFERVAREWTHVLLNPREYFARHALPPSAPPP